MAIGIGDINLGGMDRSISLVVENISAVSNVSTEKVGPDKGMLKSRTVLNDMVGGVVIVKILGYFENASNIYTKLSFVKDRYL